MKIAIQGYDASFHDIAAREYFGNAVETVPCNTFTAVFDKLGGVDFGLVAIENSLYGSINEVYDLLQERDVHMCGEVYLRISQCLIGFAGTKLKDIQEVHSHPVALAQCEDYLDTQLAKAERFEHYDTAASVADVKKWGDKHKVAIASEHAAALHDMEVLAGGIETNKQNYTRFVVIDKTAGPAAGANKTSLVITTHSDTKPGALYNALGAFAKRDINLFMLHSRPVIGKAWAYQFYIDVGAGASEPRLQEALQDLTALGCSVMLLGSYKAGR